MKEKKEIKENNKNTVIVVAILMVAICFFSIYFLRNNLQSKQTPVLPDERFAQYINTIKELRNFFTDEEDVVEREYIYLFTNEKHNEGNVNNLEIKLLKNEEVYVSNINETDPNTKELYKKYGEEYKIGEGVIDIVGVSNSEYGSDYIFLIREDGSLGYIYGVDLMFGEIKVKKIPNAKNIINVITVDTQEKTKIIAIDIDGNSVEILI